MENNILLPFPSDYDEKLKVSSLDPNTEVEIVKTTPKDYQDRSIADVLYGLPKVVSTDNTPDGVGAVRFSRDAIRKLRHSVSLYATMEDARAYIEALPYTVEILKSSLLLEEHRDRKKNVSGKRRYYLPSDPSISKVQRLYGAILLNGGNLYRTKSTVKVYQENLDAGKHHGIEIVKIELISPKTSNLIQSEVNLPPLTSSISLAKLLKGVELSYEPNVKLLDAMQACHQFALSGDYTELVRVYETARNKRLSTTLSDPLQSVKQAQAEMVASTQQATHVVVPSSPVQEQAQAILNARGERNENTLKDAQEEQVERKSQSYKL